MKAVLLTWDKTYGPTACEILPVKDAIRKAKHHVGATARKYRRPNGESASRAWVNGETGARVTLSGAARVGLFEMSLHQVKERALPPRYVTGTITHDGHVSGCAEYTPSDHGWRNPGRCWRWDIAANDWSGYLGHTRLSPDDEMVVLDWLDREGFRITGGISK